MAESSSARWYDEPKNEVHECAVGVFGVIRDECMWRLDADEYHAALYRNSDSPGVKGESRKGYAYGPASLPYNVARSAVDTLQAKIAKHRPLPQVLTQRGSWKNQKRARKQTQFLEGEFYRQRIYERHAPMIVRDALIFGRGILKLWTQDDRICTERVHPWELWVDEFDGRYAEPRNLYHCRTVDKGVLVETFGRTKDGGLRRTIVDAIEKAGRFSNFPGNYETARSSTVDRIDILEAWHLPSAPGAKDGRHVVVIQGATLVDEAWTLDYFPFAILSYSEPLNAFWGYGLVEQVEGYAYQINEASEKSAEQHRMSGVGVLVPDGSAIHDQNFRNGINILRYRPGLAPTVFQMDLVNEHTRQRPRELTQDALNDLGLSQMSVQSQKPAGITAGIALETLDDIETERFMIFGRAYEAWNLEIARRLIDCAKHVAKVYGDLKVSVPMKGGLLDLSWNDVEVEGVELRVFPTSLLPQQLGARLDKLKTLFDAQLIDRATFLRHLDAPDLQAELDLETADRLVIDEILEVMLDAEEDEGESRYIPPSAYQDLKWAGRRAQQKLNRAILDGAPEYNKDFLRRYLKEVDGELQKMAAKAAAANNTQMIPGAAPAPTPGTGPAGPAPGAPPPMAQAA